VTIDGVWIGEFGLLTTCTHHSEVPVTTALSLVSTFYKSLAQAKFSQSSLDISWQRLLTVEILQLPLSGPFVIAARAEHLSTFNSSIASPLLTLPCRAQQNCQPSTEIRQSQSQSQSQSYITTGGLPPISYSLRQAP
jgi:hypothetical protein